MENIKHELLNKLKEIGIDLEYIKAISISKFVDYEREFEVLISAENEIDLDLLDVEYDNGYGLQEVKGIVLFDDNSWLERAEYDGAEWWEYRKPPTIKEVLEFNND